MLKSFFFLFSYFICFYLLAQQNPRSEVGLYNGHVSYPRYIQEKFPILKEPFLLLDDSVSYPISMVDYFRKDGNYYIYRLMKMAGYTKLTRLDSGIISSYSYIIKNYGSGSVPGPNGMPMYTGPSSKKAYAYEINKQLKPMTISNLLLDVDDHQPSVDILHSIQKRKKLNTLLWVGGGLITLVGLIKMTQDFNAQGPPYDDAKFRPNAILIIGVVTTLVPFFISSKNDLRMREAIHVYNNK